MTEHIEYFDKLIQNKLEQLPRAIKGEAPKEHLYKILKEIDFLKDAKEALIMRKVSRSAKVNKTKVSVKCLHCGRSFIKKLPHKCNTGYRKRNHKWLELTDD